MINILEEKRCCGCSACVEKCPKQCVSLCEDKEGFLYPIVDKSICVDCGICEKVCPMINPNSSRLPLKVYASINRNEKVRMASSSGGIFTLLAEKILAEGGVVFGACFDDSWEVKMTFAENLEGVSCFSGSKYVQARVERTYEEAEFFLKQGREVLYSGTPCQIAGLKKFLRREYKNLLAVDFVCHGVPSPKVWRQYLSETVSRQCNEKKAGLSQSKSRDVTIDNVEFRSKSTGWKKYSFVLTLSETKPNGEKDTISLSSMHFENIYMRAFLANLTLRPSCYECPFKECKSGSDITIADFWGIEKCAPDMDDDKGTGLVLVNTQKGMSFFPDEKVRIRECSYHEATAFNTAALSNTVKPHPNRSKFFFLLNEKRFTLDELVGKMLAQPLGIRIRNYVIHLIRHYLYIDKL